MARKTIFAIITQQYDALGIEPCVFESEENARTHVDRLREKEERKNPGKSGPWKRFYTIQPVNFVRTRKVRRAPNPEADCYRCGLPLADGGGRDCDCGWGLG